MTPFEAGVSLFVIVLCATLVVFAWALIRGS